MEDDKGVVCYLSYRELSQHRQKEESTAEMTMGT